MSALCPSCGSDRHLMIPFGAPCMRHVRALVLAEVAHKARTQAERMETSAHFLANETIRALRLAKVTALRDFADDLEKEGP